jgi:hypothetical protein
MIWVQIHLMNYLMRGNKIMKYIACALYNCFLLAVFTYSVFVLGHSGWWFLLMVCLFFRTKETE